MGIIKMKRQILIISLILLFITSYATAADVPYKEGELIVRFVDPAASIQTKNNILKSVLGSSGSPVVKEYSIVPGLTLAKLPASMTVEQSRVLLTQSPAILYAGPNYKIKACVIPNDSRFSELWGMNNTGQTGGTVDADIDAPEAWNLQTGSSGVIVAVTDSGVDYNHPDLLANRWVNTGEIPGNGLDDDGNGYIDDIYGYDFVNVDANPMDDYGHGTHVSGTIGAVGNNNMGVVGVCWTVKIMALKMLDENGSGTLDDAISAIQYATANGARVINASWGGYFTQEDSQGLYDAIAAARNAGILFVAAAGNANLDNDTTYPPNNPSSYNLDNIIAVLATTNTDQKAGFSNYGLTSVDLGAPGDNILSTIPGGGYDLGNGTSMASPHVAGACALLLSADPSLTYTEVKQILLDHSDLLPSLTSFCASGGRLNLFNAIQEIVHDTTPPLPDPAEWAIVPQATGLHTIAMEARKASDRSGVEYFFKCINDSSKNSSWQSGTQYARSDFNANTTYTFTVKYRDKSDNHNETGPSTAESTTTANGSDNLPPFPNPSQWSIKPKLIRLQPSPKIRMEAKASSDESSPVWYYFKCTNVNPAVPDPNVFNSGWIGSNIYEISSGLTLDYTYTFTVKAKDNLDNQTTESIQASVTVSAQGANILTVPVPYPTIQSAINASSNGDIIEVRPGIYKGIGNRDVNFAQGLPAGQTRAITLRSIDTNDPSVIAATIIDCNEVARAFDFRRGEGLNSIVTGFTIRNGWSQGPAGLNGTPFGGYGTNGGDAYGGAIRCVGSSPSIRNCVIIDCLAVAGSGGAGAIGTPYIPGTGQQQPTWAQDGGDGGNGGSAYGGGIYCNTTSHPLINNCEIRGCYAIGGLGGPGGNGGDAHRGDPNDPNDQPQPPTNGGDGGDGGSGYGGGIYLAATTHAIISNCRIMNDNEAIGWGGAPGGQGGSGLGIFPDGNPGDAGANGYARGGGVYYGSASVGNMSNTLVSDNYTAIFDWNWDIVNLEVWAIPGSQGGGIYCAENSIITLTGCSINNNEAIEGDGGGIWYEFGGTLTLNNCTVSGNRVPEDGYGGGILAGCFEHPLNTTVIIDNDSTISGNEGGYGGGGMMLVETNLTINDSTINGNTSFVEGAGMMAYNCIADVNNSTVRDNSTTELGGGFSIINGIATINNSYLTGNSADGSLAGNGTGGALFFEGWSDYPHQVNNCLITDNNALSDGGGLSTNIGSWVQVTNCTFIGNEATGDNGVGGAISCAEYWAYTEILNSILWGNEATAGGSQIAVGDPDGSPPYGNGPYADVDASYSDVQGGEEGVWIEDESQTYTAFWWLTGSINEDPLFATTSTTEQTYFLSQIVAGQLVDSPCVDSGNGIAIPGTTRTDYVADSCTVDMGYHYPAAGTAPQYSLTIEVVNDTGGTLSATGGGDDAFIINAPPISGRLVNQGTVVSLQALVNAGYALKKWTGTDNDSSTDPNNTVTMDSDKVIKVEFYQFLLTIQVYTEGDFEPNGTLYASSTLPTDPFTLQARKEPNSRPVTPGTVVALNAVPDADYRVWFWSGTNNDTSTATTNTVTMNSDKTVTVAFELDGMYYLIVHIIGNGTVTPSGRTFHTQGEVVALTATPDNPFNVVIWTGTDDDFSDSHNNTVTMNTNKEVTVEFYAPRTLYVPADYTNIQLAINDAHSRDIISIAPGVYDAREAQVVEPPVPVLMGFETEFLYINGKDITITSANPDDPCVVAATVLTRAKIVMENVGRNTVINGITIRDNLSWWYVSGLPGDAWYVYPNTGAGLDGIPGLPGLGGALQLGGTWYWHDHRPESRLPFIFWLGPASPTIKNCIFRNCGALGIYSANANSGPDADGDPGHGSPGGKALGGGVYCGPDCRPIFINCSFIGCYARGGDGGNGGNDPAGHGGGWGDPDAYWYTEYGPFEEFWKYSGYGGAVYCDINSTPEFVDCKFTDNYAVGGCSGISGTDAGDEREGWPYLHYRIDAFGGVAYAAAGSSPKFTGCTFTNNEVDVDGIEFWREGEGDAADSFTDDPFISYGGAIALEDGATPTFDKCTFNGNLSTIGGGMYSSHCNPLINDCNFINNSALHGGGALFVGGTFDITKSIFNENESTYTAGQGGGICCLGANTGIIDCSFVKNVSYGSGGGIYISSQDINSEELPGENKMLIKNCLIAGNSADRDGGGVSANWQSEPNIVNCTIADNVVTGIGFENSYGGGLYGSYGSYINIINSIIWGNIGNIGTQGSQLAVGTDFKYSPMPSTVNITYSDIQDATDPNAFGARIEALDLVFCIDSTGSMVDDIAAVKDAAYEITSAISTQMPDSRIAVVEYKDFNSLPYGGPTDFPYRTALGFSTVTSDVVSAIDSITASGGADFPESVYAALMHCIDHDSLAATLGDDLHGADPASLGPGAWRSGNVLRVIILMGDAEPHDPEPFTNYTSADIIAAATVTEPKRIVPLLIGGDANTAASFSNLAAQTGGTVLQAATAEEVVDALLAAIELISKIPDPIIVDTNCVLNWNSSSYSWSPNSHNIDKDPCFVSGYYLSQIAAGQAVDSACVNAGSDTAENLGMDKYTTRTDGVFDEGIVDMGYHYLFGSWIEACKNCELFHDGIINFKDFALFVLNWLDEDCSSDNDWCNHADVTFDTYVNFEDLLLFTHCWLLKDDYPPLPNPTKWAVEPYSSPGIMSITMTAETTADKWGGIVEYYFDCVYGGGHDSGWRADPNYTDTGLVTGTEYGYKVRARDAGGNMTGWSPVRYAEVGEEVEDNNPPTPNPMTWATAPYATSSTSIAMVASTAIDDTAGVEYYFEDYDIPAVNSGWQSSPIWEDTTCAPETTYRYRVRARDTSPMHNQTAWSFIAEATTPAEGEEPDTNPPEPVEWEIPPYETGGGLYAYANMTAVEATDPEGNGPVEYYFECVGAPHLNSGWMTEREWNNVFIGTSGQYLLFHFRVRDSLQNTSAWSTSLPCY